MNDTEYSDPLPIIDIDKLDIGKSFSIPDSVLMDADLHRLNQIVKQLYKDCAIRNLDLSQWVDTETGEQMFRIMKPEMLTMDRIRGVKSRLKGERRLG